MGKACPWDIFMGEDDLHVNAHFFSVFLTLEVATVPSLKPFFSFLQTFLRCLMRPVPWVFLLLALVLQLNLLFFAPSPLEAHLCFCLCQLYVPVILLKV